MNMMDKLPSGKMTAGGIAALAMWVAVKVANEYFIHAHPLPDDIATALPALAYFVVGYFVKPSATDVAKVVA